MTAIDERLSADDELEGNDEDGETSAEGEDEFDDEDAEVSLGEFDEDGDDGDADADAAADVEVALTSKEQGARQLAIRRAIEERMERRQLTEDLDYLELDDDD